MHAHTLESLVGVRSLAYSEGRDVGLLQQQSCENTPSFHTQKAKTPSLARHVGLINSVVIAVSVAHLEAGVSQVGFARLVLEGMCRA